MTKYNKKKHFLLFFCLFLAMTVLFPSCTDFFSTSWASWAARNPSGLIPTVTLDNLNELIEISENDPDLSLELLTGIAEALNGASDEEKEELQAAAVEVAINAVGLGQTIISAAGAIANIKTAEDAKIVAIDVINRMPNLEETSSVLFDILNDADAFQTFINNASLEDIAMTAILIFAGEAKNSGDVEYFVAHFNPNPDPADEPELALAVDLAKYIVGSGRESELPDSLQNILDGLNLI